MSREEVKIMAPKPNVYAVIPASGEGERFGSEIPKQFIKVRGKPVICYTVEAFTRYKDLCVSSSNMEVLAYSITWIKKIILVVSSKWMNYAEELKCRCCYENVEIVTGRETRHRSIYEGIKALRKCTKSDIVLVHDAVRPFLKEDFAAEIVDAAVKYMVCGAVRKLVSTIVKITGEGFLEQSLIRSQYRESHTPQAFHYYLINGAYSKCSQDDFDNGTECLDLVQKYCSVSAKLVEGPEYLWKVTYEKDIAKMEMYLQNQYC